VGSLSRIQVGVILPKTIFGIHFIGQVLKLLLISDVFQRDHIIGIQLNISTVASLMKQILRKQNYADISVMAAPRKHVTHLFGIDVV